MSNCIQIHKPVSIPSHVIDYPRLKAMIDKANELKEAPSSESDLEGYIAWWFLGSGVVTPFNGKIYFAFGCHRSIHTWRDFRSTLFVLSKYIKFNNVPVVFDISDEYDGHASIAKIHINLKTPISE
jgi:hypothetical protein